MLTEDKILALLNYIGITDKFQQRRILQIYRKKLSSSQFGKELEKLYLTDEAIEKIIMYITMIDYRERFDKEIKKAGNKGAWGLDK